MKSHQKMKRSIQVVNIWNSLCSLNIPNPLCCARIDRCWDSALQPAPSRPGSTSPSCTYLRRETLRVKWQRREDALSPRSRAEGGHQTRRTCWDAEPRFILPAEVSGGRSSAEPRRCSPAKLEPNPEPRNYKAHHVTGARGRCVSRWVAEAPGAAWCVQRPWLINGHTCVSYKVSTQYFLRSWSLFAAF